MLRPTRRKQYVDSEVQGAMLKRIVLHWLLLFAASFLMLFFWQVLVSGPFRPVSSHLSEAWSRYAPMVVVLAVFMPTAVWDFIKLSNRFAGPMVRFRRAMRELANGKSVEPMHFRPGDFWQDMAEDFNEVLKRLNDTVPAEVDSVRSTGETVEPSEPSAVESELPLETVVS